MAKYLIVPPDALIVDRNNPRNPPVPFSFSSAVHSVLSKIIAERKMDALTAIDLDRTITTAAVGSVLKLDDAHHKLIEEEFKRPSTLTPTYVLGGGEHHIRAILDAKADPIDATSAPSAN